MTTRTKIFFDGGCRPNPGAMEYAVVAAGQVHIRHDLGSGSSMDAEWLALIAALRIGQSLGGDFVLLGDSAAVVAQANGKVKCRGNSVAHMAAFREVAGAVMPNIRTIKRTQNLAGIALMRSHSG
ncbi:ribonuclease HI [Sandarakinorhabdus sp. DWP1-3-1]|uniref:ribonuclease HI n=1 Tax=Sandarakinorhabdus sp. DWP1-3-1 TaxID=2804627 RepID=UPI003CED30C3